MSCNRKITFSSFSMLLGKILAGEKALIGWFMIFFDPSKGEKEFNSVVQQKDHILVVFYAPFVRY